VPFTPEFFLGVSHRKVSGTKKEALGHARYLHYLYLVSRKPPFYIVRYSPGARGPRISQLHT